MTDASSTPAVPVTIHRGDYRPPEWQVPDIALDFALGIDATRNSADREDFTIAAPPAAAIAAAHRILAENGVPFARMSTV